MDDLSDDFFYVTNSVRRMDVMYLLESLHFSRNSEIAYMLNMSCSYVSIITKELVKRKLLKVQKNKQYSIFSLTDKGEEMVRQLRDYHGIKGK